MDEPTASLDVQAEYDFFQEVRNIAKQHMIVMVSHRLSTIKLCTKVIYITQKDVLYGTHEELMRKSKEYYQYYKKQQTLYLER